MMVNMGYSRKDIEESLRLQKYDDIHASYLLLGRRTAEVSVSMVWYLPSFGLLLDTN